MKKCLLLLILFFCWSVNYAIAGSTYSIKYSGERELQKNGTTIAGQDNIKIIALTNTLYHFGLILPYTGNWSFEINKGKKSWPKILQEETVLSGNSGTINVTIKI